MMISIPARQLRQTRLEIHQVQALELTLGEDAQGEAARPQAGNGIKARKDAESIVNYTNRSLTPVSRWQNSQLLPSGLFVFIRENRIRFFSI